MSQHPLSDLFKLIAEEKKKIDERTKAESLALERINQFVNNLASKVEVVEPEDVVEESETLISLEQVVDAIEEIAEEAMPEPEIKDEAQVISEVAKGLFATSDMVKTPDPLTPFNQKYVTIDDMQKHYNVFLTRIQQQLSTLGGGGEVWFRWLDDVDRATIDTPEANQEHVLRYNSTTKKFFFGELTGDHREISSFTFKESGPGITPTPRMIAWNSFEDCLNVFQADGSTLQVGLENYIPVFNNTANTMTNGTVVQFAGVDANENPTISKFVAGPTAVPLYMIGVLTNDVPSGELGRATILGKVRALNTTGSDVGETWAQGDILWGHPTLPGKMTRVRPTAPNVATSIAAVLKVGVTDGIILVRPTIWPRLFYGEWYDSTNQLATAINTAYKVRHSSTGSVSGFTKNADGTTFTTQNAGLYNWQFSLQFTSTNSSSSRVWVWYRKNGVDVPHSATVLTIAANGGKLAPAWNFPVSMVIGDTFELMWATDSTSVSLSAEPANAFAPSVPSSILTVSQINL